MAFVAFGAEKSSRRGTAPKSSASRATSLPINLATLWAVRLAVIADRHRFADAVAGFRFRPLPGESTDRTIGVLVRRWPGFRFARMFLDTSETAAAFELGGDEKLCRLMWKSLETAGFAPVDETKKNASEGVTRRRSLARF